MNTRSSLRLFAAAATLTAAAVAHAQAPAAAPAPAQPASPTEAVEKIETKAVYVIPMKGEIGRVVSATPLKRVLDDARKAQPDYLICVVDFDFSFGGRKVQDSANATGGNAYNQLETVRELGVLLTDDIRDDATWTKKPQLIMWVKKALGGPAFLPFISPTIYYHSDALHGGIGYLEKAFDGRGDEVVREKQYSLRLGRAEGLAIKGGYDPRIIRGMSRSEVILSYDLVGGKAVLREDEEGLVVLTIDGSKDENKDTYENIIRGKGKAVLTLNARDALALGVSKGTVDTMDELLSELGIARNHTVVKAKAESIFNNWSDDVAEAEASFARYWKAFNETEVSGADPAERNKARGKKLGLLRNITDLLRKYKESINPRTIQGSPDGWENEIDRMTAQIQQQMRLDKVK
ncbi:MAG: hypothetical protein ACKVS8_09005 [Phycisphaerales bacterium]